MAHLLRVCFFRSISSLQRNMLCKKVQLQNGLFIHTLKLSLSICKEIRGLQAKSKRIQRCTDFCRRFCERNLMERSSTQAREASRVTCSDMANINTQCQQQTKKTCTGKLNWPESQLWISSAIRWRERGKETLRDFMTTLRLFRFSSCFKLY